MTTFTFDVNAQPGDTIVINVVGDDPPVEPPEFGENLFPFNGSFLDPANDVSGSKAEIAARVTFEGWNQDPPFWYDPVKNTKGGGLHRPLEGDDFASLQADRDYRGNDPNQPVNSNVWPNPPEEPEAVAWVDWVDRVPKEAEFLELSWSEAHHIDTGDPGEAGNTTMQVLGRDDQAQPWQQLFYLEGTVVPAVTPETRVMVPVTPRIIALPNGGPKYLRFIMWAHLIGYNAGILRGNLSLKAG